MGPSCKISDVKDRTTLVKFQGFHCDSMRHQFRYSKASWGFVTEGTLTQESYSIGYTEAYPRLPSCGILVSMDNIVILILYKKRTDLKRMI
jgi:hypothetical protein